MLELHVCNAEGAMLKAYALGEKEEVLIARSELRQRHVHAHKDAVGVHPEDPRAAAMEGLRSLVPR